MLENMKSFIERHSGKIGKKQIQHHDLVKIEHISHFLTKIEVVEWIEHLLKELKVKLGPNVMLALTVAKIDDRTTFKDVTNMKKKEFSPRKKAGNMGASAKTIKSQKNQVKRALEKTLTKIPAERDEMELRLMPQLRRDIDTRQKTRFRNAMVRHK